MFEEIVKFFKKLMKSDVEEKSKNAAKERLHLVLTQDRANVSADFLAMMKQEIIEVIKKYIDIDENEIDVRLTNKPNEDGTVGSPTLYANIPIISVKNDVKTSVKKEENIENVEGKKEESDSPEVDVGALLEETPLGSDAAAPLLEQSVDEQEEIKQSENVDENVEPKKENIEEKEQEKEIEEETEKTESEEVVEEKKEEQPEQDSSEEKKKNEET